MISIITGSIGVLAAVVIVVLMRKDRLHAQHGLGWIIVAIGFSLLGLSPNIIDQLAKFLGVGYPPVLALTAAIVVLVIKILLMDIERSRIDIRNQRLIQRVAMMEADMNTLLNPDRAQARGDDHHFASKSTEVGSEESKIGA